MKKMNLLNKKKHQEVVVVVVPKTRKEKVVDYVKENKVEVVCGAALGTGILLNGVASMVRAAKLKKEVKKLRKELNTSKERIEDTRDYLMSSLDDICPKVDRVYKKLRMKDEDESGNKPESESSDK